MKIGYGFLDDSGKYKSLSSQEVPDRRVCPCCRRRKLKLGDGLIYRGGGFRFVDAEHWYEYRVCEDCEERFRIAVYKSTKIKSETMNRYTIYYEDKDGDLTHVWVWAVDSEDAISKVKQEYWDVERIVSVDRMKDN